MLNPVFPVKLRPMDISVKLRVLLWVLVLGLWGSIAADFMRDDSYQPPRLTTLNNPFLRPDSIQQSQPPAQNPVMPADVKTSLGPMPALAALPPAAKAPLPQAAPPPQPEASPLPIPPPHARFAGDVSRRPVYGGVPHEWGGVPARGATWHLRRHQEVPAKAPLRLEAPPGFSAARTEHFLVYYEGTSVPKDFLSTIEDLHSNVMLDLAAFAPWGRTERVTLYVFQTQEAYQSYTGRPAWSGGAASVERRTIYLYRSSELIGILAHEMCHVYFDNFFNAGHPDPLWLSEGMATYIQIERGLAAPNWLKPNMDILLDGEGFSFKRLMRMDDLSRSSDADVRLWYTEAYSVVRFLVRSRYFVSYYQFCRALRDGDTVPAALAEAYGDPYNNVSSLEFAWRYDLRTHGISDLAMGQTAPAQ